MMLPTWEDITILASLLINLAVLAALVVIWSHILYRLSVRLCQLFVWLCRASISLVRWFI
jgi:phosphoglycerate-specific signal transduction histidine kinase